ncbi:hypothetical protein FDECE_10222 [Fusarium decemcellulare]|nr:hypothetical protein FDECE_10222 [Fusarium decemcellulare]
MRFIQPALQLLALCQLAFVSRCKPDSSSATSIVPTSSSDIPSTSLSSFSTTVSEEPSSTSESTTSSSETATTSMVTTSSIESSTTTSSISQEPTNLVRNPGWEAKDTITPWERYGDFGTVSLSTSEFHEGSQSGYFKAVAGGPANMGFKQSIDPSLIEVGKPCQFTAFLDAGPNVQVRGICERLSFYIDDAVLEAVAFG